MAGDSQTGGGGSVYWTIDVDKLDFVREETACQDGDGRGRRFHETGRDRDGVTGKDRFTISIKVPDDDKEAAIFRKMLQQASSQRGRVTFTLPIEDNPNQIRITWGNRPSRGKSASRRKAPRRRGR